MFLYILLIAHPCLKGPLVFLSDSFLFPLFFRASLPPQIKNTTLFYSPPFPLPPLLLSSLRFRSLDHGSLQDPRRDGEEEGWVQAIRSFPTRVHQATSEDVE